MTLQRLEPYFGTQFFLVDLETGEMFAYIRQQWRQAGLYCSNQPFVINDLIPKVERHGQVMWVELETEQQTPLVDIRRSPRHFEVPPPLPAMDEPAVYVLHPDVMQVNTRKNCERQNASRSDIYLRVRGSKTHDDRREVQQQRTVSETKSSFRSCGPGERSYR